VINDIKIIVADDATQFGVMVAERISEVLTDIAAPIMLLPTGSTPRSTYQALAQSSMDSKINWPEATIFALDEYLGIAADDSRSFRAQLWAEVAIPLGLAPHQLITPNGMTGDPEAEAQRYEAEITKHSPIPLAVVGVGRNGHIAFNEPGIDFSVPTHVATLAIETRQDNASAFANSLLPTRAITVGLATLESVNTIILIAQGGHKAPAITALLRGEIDHNWPVTALVRHRNLSIILDQECFESLKL
jgi:glucosamine-6-phosphate deaminase|tara:strand:+ start:1871 stop:2611 length:741 start_codon:yes stop_codon:yes gene_type:complete